MARVTLIVNPAARGGRSAETEAVTAFGHLGFAVDVHRTRAAGDAAKFAAAHQGTNPVYTLGGDGTAMEAVSALVGRDVPVGVLPGGTGNQLARHFRIPLNVAKAVRALHNATVESLDLGRLADGRHFSLTAGFGLDAAMIKATPTALKRKLGVAAYFYGGAKALPGQKPFPIRIEADGDVVERETTFVMIANVGALLDGRFALGPGVSPTDGMLDVCVLSPRTVAGGAQIAWRMFRGDFREDSRMYFRRAKSITLTAPEGTPAQADGELLGVSQLSATTVPAAARFLVPPRA